MTMATAQTVSRDVPIELWYSPTPNGWKITILLEEAGIPYVVKPLALNGDQLTDEFLTISPNGRMPAIVDRNSVEPTTVFESGAIMWYLAKHDARAAAFWPETNKAVAEWLFWVNAGLGPMAGQLSHFTYYAPKLEPNTDFTYPRDRYKREYDRLISVMERQLANRQYLAGEYSVADMSAYGWVKPWKRWMGNDFENYPNVRRWYRQMSDRPAVKRGLDVLRDGAVAAQASREGKTAMESKQMDTLFKQKGASKL